MGEIHALAAKQAGAKLEPYSYDPGPLGDEQVEIEVQYCGICASDIGLIENEAGWATFPLVPGHEAIGKVVAVGSNTKLVKPGQTVGLGWNSGSDLYCRQCLNGDYHLCDHIEMTIVGRHGAYATRVRCHWIWATPIPEGVNVATAGPLLCGGITVFSPIIDHHVKPTDRVGVVGIGGLGHMAVRFLNHWGCHVTAFTTSAGKADELKKLGAHAIVNTHSEEELNKIQGSLNFIISTVSGKVDFGAYLNTLAPRGHFHQVGILPEATLPLPPLFLKQRSFGGSPSGPPATVMAMLDFCARHGIQPITEELPMSKANEGIERVKAGKARYRIVLNNDLQ
ncbi:MAG: NAD(P)-dependent alcohol dehydrogenase [Acidobacteriaceae bacterium]|nr:NAD(P)-dependent alcohol dehydrogenase [Acidobacteriaceae bacterium]